MKRALVCLDYCHKFDTWLELYPRLRPRDVWSLCSDIRCHERRWGNDFLVFCRSYESHGKYDIEIKSESILNTWLAQKQNFLRDQSGMKKQLLTLQQLISVMDPELYRHLGVQSLLALNNDIELINILQRKRMASTCSFASGQCGKLSTFTN